MAGCETCGGTQVLRKSNVVFEVGFGGGVFITSNSKNRHMRCTLDVCGGCGRTTTYINDPQAWAQAVGVEQVFDLGGPAGAVPEPPPDPPA